MKVIMYKSNLFLYCVYVLLQFFFYEYYSKNFLSSSKFYLNTKYIIFVSPLPLVIERIIQRRISDSVNFDRDWDDYVTGFGEADGSFWLGLEEIHQLTTTHNVSLYMNIETFVGQPFTMKLDEFSVGNATTNYAWNYSWFSQSSDRVKDSILGSAHNGMMFSTRDRDNDIWNRNCASDRYRGGWWYNDCARINLNGDYEGNVTPTYTGIVVENIDTTTRGPSASKAVKSVEMIIRTRV